MELQNFLNSRDLTILLRSAIANYDPYESKNIICLNNADEVIEKIIDHFWNEQKVRVKFLHSFIFLASSTTMSSRALAPDQGWHTDGTSQIIDGDCYNVWIPIYNDAALTGVEVIPEKGNEKFYESLGDPTYPLLVYVRETAPWVFDILDDQIPPNCDMLFVKSYSGTIIPVVGSQLKIMRTENPCVGDVAIFKQTEVHRGFHKGGIRIQLSLKFQNLNSTLNAKPSNNLYKLFETFTKGSGDLEKYMDFMKLFMPKSTVSKHGMLEKDLIMSLMKNTYQELNRSVTELESL